ncbi:uncharacterized protein L201_000553 [Kwoniella dendrophila CBS 6074]|uniref:Thioredoxin-like fold domain-containing protein n=1 Tax=Kwoniella dendrophila CBS 6074 TaxID=1295534 RepID=A0AAX4JJV1_9TREE
MFSLSLFSIPDDFGIPFSRSCLLRRYADQTSLNSITSPEEPSQGLLGTIKHIYNIAVNGPDNSLIYERDIKDGIERLTDENYAQLVESSTNEDEVWVVLVHGKPTDMASDKMLNYHKEAADLVKSDEKLNLNNNIRFARLDYMTAWKTCTRWLLTKPPYLVFISSSGEKLRFVPVHSLGKEPENLYKVIKDKMYEIVLPWNNRWSPGGDRSQYIEYYIIVQDKISKLTSGIPNWILVLGFGIFTQQLMSYLHTGSDRTRTSTSTTQVVREQKVVVKEDE